MRKVRRDPRISINQLGAYMVANATGRRRTIRDQKYPPTYMVIYYSGALKPILSYYTDPAHTLDEVSAELERLESLPAASESEDTRNKSCAEALAAFLDLSDELDLSEYEIRRGDDDPPKISIEGVEVSVRPDLLLIRNNRLVGSVKFYFKKGQHLEKAAAEVVGTLQHQYLEEVYEAEPPSHRDCFTVDVFAGKAFRAPRSFRRRRSDIAAACDEIRLRWSGV